MAAALVALLYNGGTEAKLFHDRGKAAWLPAQNHAGQRSYLLVSQLQLLLNTETKKLNKWKIRLSGIE